MTTLLLALWLLGADIVMPGETIEEVLIEFVPEPNTPPPQPLIRLVGPVLTEEKCFVYDVNPRYGRKVCVELVEMDGGCLIRVGSELYSAYPSTSCVEKVLSRHCWCAEQEPAK